MNEKLDATYSVC